MNTITVTGSRIENINDKFEDFEIKESIEISKNRASGEIIKIDINESDIINLIYADGTEWIGYQDDLKEISPSTRNRNDSAEDPFPMELKSNNNSNRSAGSIALKYIKIFNKAAAGTAQFIAEKIDNKLIPNPGLYKVNAEFELQAINELSIQSGKYLLLLHGTISDTLGSFGDLKGETWKKITATYNTIITLEHHTLSLSPMYNALDILNILPRGSELDIISHSRGGLIADVLARCDVNNNKPAYSDKEVNIFRKGNHEGYPELCEEINSIAGEKRIIVNNIIRVACPAAGTTLLGKRVDVLLNALLNLIGTAFGSKANIYYECIKEFLLAVVAQKEKSDGIPGLWAMVPESDYQKVNNRRDILVKCKTYTICGDSEIGGWNSLVVILSNLYYLKSNDLIVDTKSMTKGVYREAGIFKYISRDSKTHHFNYFKNKNTVAAILAAMDQKSEFIYEEKSIAFEKISSYSTDRGIIKSGYSLISSKPFNTSQKITGHKPIILLLPGIMGSTLSYNGKDVWFDLGAIASGELKNSLTLSSSKDVKANGLLSKFYQGFAENFSKDFDVITFPFDWRDSIYTSAEKLKNKIEELSKYNQPLNIVAHSMGGLVVKALMLSDIDFWQEFIKVPTSKFLMLGTPWLGSYLIMEVLTGDARNLNFLDFLDDEHTKSDLLKVVSGYKGMIEMLPINSLEFEKISFWEEIEKYLDFKITSNLGALNAFQIHKAKTNSAESKKYEFDKIYYLAGSDKTIFNYKLKHNLFGNYLQYETIPLGDGSVTYELGIPKDIKPENLYYCKSNHTFLPTDKENFEGIRDILIKGKTSRFDKAPIIKRGENEITEIKRNEYLFSYDEDEIINNLFEINKVEKNEETISQTIKVSVLNADLKYAKYPVMVGHFLNDGIYSGEKALNKFLNNKLSERHRMGYYPGLIGESEVTFNRTSQPSGALVIGMGTDEDLTSHRLSVSVEKAIIKYSFFFRDNYEDVDIKRKGSGISSLFIGSSFAELPLEDSIKAILLGVKRANEKILKLDNDLMTIKEIELIDYYEDKAHLAHKILKRICDKYKDVTFIIDELKVKGGKRKRLLSNDNSGWWHNFTTIAKYKYPINNNEISDKVLKLLLEERRNKPYALEFSSQNNKARVEMDDVESDLAMVEYLSKEFSHKDEWDNKLAKTMFELLVPNDFKSIIRNQSNIVWKLDEYSAQFPWEMFHDYNFGDEPTFINTGLIRQLYTRDYRLNPTIVESMTALVVGDPNYHGKFIQLPGAEAEARLVSEKLSNNQFIVNECIKSNAHDIVKELYSKEYKVLHFAAHGVHDENKSGIVIGPDIYLTPGTINQMSAIPELIFINCCYSGDMSVYEEKYYKEKNKLAANIGTQLIKMGVKAIVVAGWAVNDNAAKCFAEEFYSSMLEGYEFGEAVQKARRKCYDLYSNNNTWGAFQCYGDHYYKLVNHSPSYNKNEEYLVESEVIYEVENFLSLVKGQKVNIENKIEHLKNIEGRLLSSKIICPYANEIISSIYAELGYYDESIDIIEKLMPEEHSGFTVRLLEQYCSLRGKQLVKQFNSSREKIKADLLKTYNNHKDKDFEGNLKERIEYLSKNASKQISKIEDDIKYITSIGKNSERLALLGSLYKRAIMISNVNEKNDVEKQLQMMKESFYKSYTFAVANCTIDSVYPLTNYFLAVYGLDQTNNIKIGDISYTKAKVKEHLENILYKLKKDVNIEASYYNSNSIAKIITIQFLYFTNDTNHKESKDFEKKLIDNLIDSIKNHATIKHILGEIEHFEFIKFLLEYNNNKKVNARRDAIDRIINTLKEQLIIDEK